MYLGPPSLTLLPHWPLLQFLFFFFFFFSLPRILLEVIVSNDDILAVIHDRISHQLIAGHNRAIDIASNVHRVPNEIRKIISADDGPAAVDGDGSISFFPLHEK
eukprot:TRINITY_DN6301_c0_g1_i2.p1 TRINITY_DN6301_c0_g1~~TRINITY_DN6301_c0_g1_i2.p1  ORF type:complete len:104 (-),score=16.78 TRINITY_DN6301_c0_g1_i2:217-528(-)